jgi:transcription termination factor NusB
MDKVYYNEMSELIPKNESFYLEVLSKYAPKFELSSMNIMYVLPIFIGLAEMFHLTEEIPAKVSINEAVEMAKAF